MKTLLLGEIERIIAEAKKANDEVRAGSYFMTSLETGLFPARRAHE